MIYYSVNRKCVDSHEILQVKHPRTSMTFNRFVLKRHCVPWNVSSSFMCSFWMKFICQVLKSYKIIFRLKTSGRKSPRTNQGSFRKDSCLEPKVVLDHPIRLRQSIASWMVEAPQIEGLGQYLTLGAFLQRPALFLNHGSTRRSIGWGTSHRLGSHL